MRRLELGSDQCPADPIHGVCGFCPTLFSQTTRGRLSFGRVHRNLIFELGPQVGGRWEARAC